MSNTIIFCVLIFVYLTTAFATFNGSSYWNVGTYGANEHQSDGKNCIIFRASMRFKIKYQHTPDKDNKTESEVSVFTPEGNTTNGEITVNHMNSSCMIMDWPSTQQPTTTTVMHTTTTNTKSANAATSSTTTASQTTTTTTATKPSVNESAIFQRIELKFWDNWRLGFVFTNNMTVASMGGGQKAFVLYSVDLDAHLNKLPYNFPNVTVQGEHMYEQTNISDGSKANEYYWKKVSVEGSNQAEKCLHIQSLVVTDKFTLDLVNLTVIAFTNINKLSDVGTQTCPQDVPFDDTIDIIIGAIMSAIVTIVMIVYLLYRLKKGPSKIPKHLMPKPPKQSVSTVDGGHPSINNSTDK